MMPVKKRFSIKIHTLIILIIVWGMLFVLITVYGQLTRQTLASEVQKTNENMLDLYGQQLDSLCTEINRALSSINLSEYPVKISNKELSEILSSYVLLYDDKFSFCFYDQTTESAILRVASNIAYEERNDILEFFKGIDEQYQPGSWNVVYTNFHYYLMRFYYKNACYVGSWISLDNALSLYKNNQFDENAILYFSGDDGTIYTQTAKFDQIGDHITDAKYMSRNYLALSHSMSNVQLNLSFLIPYEEIFRSFRFITIMQWLVVAAFAFSVIVLFYYINYFLFRPLKDLSDAMKEVESGNYDILLTTDDSSLEFYTVNTAFNDMVAEIKYLKESVYEREIFNQRLELEKLQLQVKPHFYLNCLNIIFNLSQGGEYKLIQDLCMAQIKYFRYMMKSSFATVTIREEFDHIQNYLHIQELRYPGRYNIEMSLNSDVEDILIPPLILHVFAENVVNHVSSYGKINFAISARVNADDQVQITISDDGPGFPEDVLSRLQSGELLDNENGSHIGISNSVKRLHLYYHDDCRIVFQNLEDHGAVIYITIPKNPILTDSDPDDRSNEKERK